MVSKSWNDALHDGLGSSAIAVGALSLPVRGLGRALARA
jgi:hypothetical protein